MSKSATKEIPAHTRDEVLRLAKKVGMTEKEFISEITKAGCGGHFRIEYWKKYMQVIFLWEWMKRKSETVILPSCPICGGEQIIDYSLIGKFKSHSAMSGARCKMDRHHFFMDLEARRQADLGIRGYEDAIKYVIDFWAHHGVVYKDSIMRLEEIPA